MEKKHRSIIALALILCVVAGQFLYYTLPVELPYLEEIEQCSQVKVLPVYKGLEQDHEQKILTQEEILELKAFLQSNRYNRKPREAAIRVDSDTTYRITFTWSDGRYVQLRTFGDNDTFVWDSEDLRFLQTKDENWHSALENLLINEEKPPKRVAFLLS